MTKRLTAGESVKEWARITLELCRGNGVAVESLIRTRERDTFFAATFWVILGSAAYGAAVGIWRDPRLSAYVALKLPALILLTTAGNALINGMAAQLSGISFSFRQSGLAILCSFAIAATILLSLTPIALAMAVNAPGPETTDARRAHAVMLQFHVVVIGLAGVTANWRLFGLLKRFSSTGRQAAIVLACWIGGNALLGTQLSWMMRPFFGTPNIPVQFLRDNPLDGNFFEAVFRSVFGG